MAIYTPYFYIIQDTRNGMYYAGAKWGKDADPATFMVDGGYITSSGVIKYIVEQHTVNVFTVRVLRVFDTAYEAWHYETRFLRKVRAKTNPVFYNMHENDGRMNLNKVRDVMIEKYGVENPMQSTEIQEKRKLLSLEKHGVDHYSKTTQYREKYSETCMSRFGTDNPFKSEAVKEKIRGHNIEKYGVPYLTGTREHREVSVATWMRKHGVDNPFKSETVKEKIKNSNRCARGYDYPTQSPLVRQKIRKIVEEKYSVSNVSQIPEVKQRVRVKRQERVEREIVKQIKRYRDLYKCSLQKSWVFKSDEWLQLTLDRLVGEYGPLPAREE